MKYKPVCYNCKKALSIPLLSESNASEKISKHNEDVFRENKNEPQHCCEILETS
jgi:hypothetical protein